MFVSKDKRLTVSIVYLLRTFLSSSLLPCFDFIFVWVAPLVYRIEMCYIAKGLSKSQSLP
jgi:hypothetical protein